MFSSKEVALQKGIVLNCRGSLSYSTHRYHANIVDGMDVISGRTGDASSGEGIAIARVASSSKSHPSVDDVYILVTYRFPVVSAMAVPALIQFASETNYLQSRT